MERTSIPNIIEARAKDFKYCEDIVRRYSEDFHKAFSALPVYKAKCAYAIMAFYRMVTEVATRQDAQQKLQAIEYKLNLFLSGNVPKEPIWRTLEVLFLLYPANPQPLWDLMRVSENYLNFKQPQTQYQMEEYCRLVMGGMWVMLLPILTNYREELREDAMGLGVAMCITKILRDIGEDLSHGIVFLPRQYFAHHNYTMQQLKQHVLDYNFICLWESEARRAEDLYHNFEQKACLLHEDSQVAVMVALSFERQILTVVRENDYQCFTKRNAVPNVTKRRILRQFNAGEAVRQNRENQSPRL